MLRIDAARFLALTASLAAACARANPAPAPAPIVATAPAEVDGPDAAATAAEPAPDAALAGPSAETARGPSAEDAVASDYMEGPADEYGSAGIGSLLAPGGAGLGTGRIAGSGFIGSTPDAGAPGVGSLDPAIIQRVMRANVKKVKACYDAELKSDPSFETKLTARFVIGTSGAVESVSITNPSGRASLDSCVIGALKRLRFPAPKGGKVTVSYPFVFKST